MKDFFRRMTLVAALGVVTVSAPLMVGAPARAAEPKEAASKAPATTQDELILSKNGGTVVRGQILEETAVSVTIMVEFPGMPAVKTTYPKSDIVKINRGLPVDAVATIKADNKPVDRVKEQLAPTATAEDDAAKFMVIEFKGEIGRDITLTPMTELFERVDKQFNDLDSSGNVEPGRKEKNILVFEVDAETNPGRGFDGFFAAEKLATLLEQQMDKGRRVVFWIKRAVGGAAGISLICPEIYWKSDGEFKGAGPDLESFDIGDKMVNEKQISLRMGHAEGVPIRGGYGAVGVAVVRALARSTNWLVVRMEGGKPVILERAPTEADFAESPNWTILKDDGKDKNKDAKLTEGNDRLNLRADWARNLGISKGTADTVEDLAFQFGVQRNWKEIEKPDAQKALADWSEAIDRAVARINTRPRPGTPRGTLWRDLDDIDGEPAATFDARQKANSRRINILKQVQAILTRYKEVFDPEGQQVSQLDLRIMQIREEMATEKRAQQRGR